MPRTRYRYFYISDLLTLGLCLFFSLCSFLNTGKLRLRAPWAAGLGWDREIFYGLLFLALASLLLLFCKIANRSTQFVVRFFRMFYVQLLYIIFFSECIILSQLFFGSRSLDGFFFKLEQLIFGAQPARQFYLLLPDHPLVTELFFFSYFFYYALICVGLWLLFLKGRRDEAARSLAVITCGFYLFYIFYTFFPVQGPKYYIPELRALWYENFHGYLFTRIMKGMFKRMNLAGAAFPSSHVAMSLLALILNWRSQRRLALALVPLTLTLMASTVYIYAHYLVDVLAGLPVGLLLYNLLPRLLALLDNRLSRTDRMLGRLLRLEPLTV
jgi:membrane-associated phospholipid phosphatase